MLFIYILKLENDKYYIGKTKNPDFRINNHFNKAGSYWTLMHKPLEVIELIENCDEFDEDKYTKKYMSIYGIDNVRGGSYCEIVFSSQTRQFIKRELNSATDKCFYCGKIIARDEVRKRVRCVYCGSKILFKTRSKTTVVKAI